MESVFGKLPPSCTDTVLPGIAEGDAVQGTIAHDRVEEMARTDCRWCSVTSQATWTSYCRASRQLREAEQPGAHDRHPSASHEGRLTARSVGRRLDNAHQLRPLAVADLGPVAEVSRVQRGAVGEAAVEQVPRDLALVLEVEMHLAAHEG